MSEISKELENKIRVQAENRCGYCLVPQKLISYKLEIEHIFPRGLGGSSDEENLWLSCRQCNLSKGVKTHGFDAVTFERIKIFNPRHRFGFAIKQRFAKNGKRILETDGNFPA